MRSRRCTGELDEAWFYSMSGHWKMIHLVSDEARDLSWHFSPDVYAR